MENNWPDFGFDPELAREELAAVQIRRAGESAQDPHQHRWPVPQLYPHR